jgi:repressor LexA
LIDPQREQICLISSAKMNTVLTAISVAHSSRTQILRSELPESTGCSQENRSLHSLISGPIFDRESSTMTELATTEKPALTARQQKIYDFIKDKIVNRGYGPTVREIGSETGIRSPNGVMCHLNALVKKGMITRQPNSARAIQLTEQPLKRMALSLAGQIAAGSPILAVPQDERIDFSKLFDNDEHYCLRVRGDSMIDDQIADGDYVIIKRQSTCRNGEIVVAIIEGQEATLKRSYKEKKKIKLQPANSKMKPIYSSDVEILGVVVGVVRNFK